MRLNRFGISLGLLVVLCLVTFVFIVRADSSSVRLENPFDGTLDIDGNIVFAYNVTNMTPSFDNCTLFIDGLASQSNLSITPLTTQYFYSYGLSNGNHNWSVSCTQSGGNVSYSDTRWFEVLIDTTAPTVVLDSPTSNSNDTDGNISFGYTVNDDSWITKCDLYTDITSEWEILQTNIFVQKNASIYFDVQNLTDNITFNWNVACYDYANPPNVGWGSANRTLTVYDNAPISSSIDGDKINEDDYLELNLSGYFSDVDGDNLTYGADSVSNISISFNGSIATIRPDFNWVGATSLTFYAFDVRNKNASSTMGFEVEAVGDTAPAYIQSFPPSGYNDNYGYTQVSCGASDDYALSNISVYSDINGTWQRVQTAQVTGSTNSSTFFLSTTQEYSSYKWGCAFYDNASHVRWSQNNSVNVSIYPILTHDIKRFTVNHIDHNRSISVDYSAHLNSSLILGNVTVLLSNGTIYFTKNLSLTSDYLNYSTQPVMRHATKIRIKYDPIFQNDFSPNSNASLNITLQYYYLGSSRFVSQVHQIQLNSQIPSP